MYRPSLRGPLRFPRLLLLSLALAASACATTRRPPLETVPHVDLQRFMGDWYVIAVIPTSTEREAYNVVESYELAPDGTIKTTFRFLDGGFDGKEKTYTPRGFVIDKETNAVWGMQFVWLIKADYRIVYLDDSASRFCSGSPIPISTTVADDAPVLRRDAALRAQRVLGPPQLADDLGGGQVAAEALPAGGAEAAVHGAARLRRNAQRAAVLLRDEDGLDGVAGADVEQPLAGAVGRGPVAEHRRRGNAGGLLQPLAQRARQVGHGAEVGRAAPVHPAQSWRARNGFSPRPATKPCSASASRSRRFCTQRRRGSARVDVQRREGLQPTAKGARVRFSAKKCTVTNGPFTDADHDIAGFWIFNVKSLDEAIDWVKRCPFPFETSGEAEIEIRQIYEASYFGAEFTPELQEAEERMRAHLREHTGTKH